MVELAGWCGRAGAWAALLSALGSWCSDGRASEAAAAPEQALSQQQVEALLDAEPGQPEADDPSAELEPPPPPPRRHGFVIEGSVGALGHLGDMRNVSATAPWFRMQLGYELTHWLMVFGEGDVALSSTRYASRPPEPRAYALFGFGAGARLSWQAFRSVGIYLQGDVGLASVTEDVLSTYGYGSADRLNPYFGACVGLEWYQINPHYALAAYGGARDYVQNFERSAGERLPLAWVSGIALRYAL